MKLKEYSKETETKIRREVLNLSINKKGSVWLQAKGSSMCPLLKNGDWLEIKPASFSSLKIGTIVATKLKDQGRDVTVHRLVKKINRPALLITRADSNGLRDCDDPVSAEYLIGKVVAIKRERYVIKIDNVLWNALGYIIIKSSSLAPAFTKSLLLILSLFSIPGRIIPKILRILRGEFPLENLLYAKAKHPRLYRPKKEDIFILRYSAANYTEADRSDIMKGQLDWEYIYDRGLKTQTVAALYRNLKTANMLSYAPYGIIERFKSVYLANTARNIRMLDEFEKIILAVNKKNIQAVPIKGFSLMLDVYDDVGVRGILDLDLLIDRKDEDEVSSIFDILGYKLVKKKVDYYSEHHYVFIARNKAISVAEVHIRFFAWYIEKFYLRIKPQDFIARSKKIIWRNIEIYKMEEIDEFIISLLSYYVADFLCLRYLLDADAILKKTRDFNWQEFLKRIKEYNIVTQVSYGIIFCKKYLNAPIPEDIIRDISFISKRAYTIEKIFPVTLRHGNMSKQESRIMRLKEAPNFKIKSSMVKEGLIWHLYRRFGLFSSSVKKKIISKKVIC